MNTRFAKVFCLLLPSKIKDVQVSLSKEGLSDKQKQKLDSKLQRLQNGRSELLNRSNEVRSEITTLALSNQMYDVTSSNKFSDAGTNRAGASFNFQTGYFEMVLFSGAGLSSFSHELKHAFQFETGDYSVGPAMEGEYKNLFYDKYDEVEAYKRETSFGGKAYGMKDLPEEYKSIETGPVDASSHPNIRPILDMPATIQRRVLQGIADRTGHAFRINGTTYYKSK